MSKTTKSKYVQQEFDDDISPPTDNQSIVLITGSKGNNLHSVVAPDGSDYLVSMPTKFRRSVWVRRGNYVLVEAIEEGCKVKAEIVKILTKDHIKYLKKEKAWPAEFDDQDKKDTNSDDLLVNYNRVEVHRSSESSDSEDTSDESDSEETDSHGQLN